MTKKATVTVIEKEAVTVELTEGMKVENILPNGTTQTGVVFMSDKNELKVRFKDEKGRTLSTRVSDKWTPIADQTSSTSLDAILEATDNKRAAAGSTETAKPEADPKPESEPEAETVEPLSADQKKRLNTLEKEFDKLEKSEQETIKKIHFAKGKVLNEIRLEKLYRETDKTFAAYALRRFGITREYAQDLARLGAFAEVAAEIINDKSVNLSVRASNQVVREGNKIASALGVEGAEMGDLAPVLNEVLAITVEATKDEKGVSEPTGKEVAAISQIVTETVKGISASEAEKAGKTVLQLAAETLGGSKADILAKYREALQNAQKSNDGNGNGTGKKRASNPSNGTWTGAAPVLSVQCSLHTDRTDNKIIYISGSSIQLKCLCRFKQIGFDFVPYEVEGKSYKPAAK